MLLTVWLGPALLVCACSPDARYRTLSFFFDGVPDPNAPPPPERRTYVTDLKPGEDPAARRPARRLVSVHPPYAEDDCTACHNLNTGMLTLPIREGLCNICHADVTEGLDYLHGPVAVADCVACHHYHASTYIDLLLDEPDQICLRCHELEKLTNPPHDALVKAAPCAQCHDPHGGGNRHFLK
jgi:predicted CXXCH cytochrome family protein